MSKMTNFLYQLFFTRDDGLDMLQLMFFLIIVYFMVAFTFVGMGKWTVTNMAWSAFISIFATLAIAGTPKWIAELLAKRDGATITPPPDAPSGGKPNDEEAEIG